MVSGYVYNKTFFADEFASSAGSGFHR